MTDHLPAFAREAHDRMLDAFDRLTDSVLQREGPAAEAKARREGATPHEATEAAERHVNKLLIEMQRARARLEAEGARRQ
jgi:hypothetical protein